MTKPKDGYREGMHPNSQAALKANAPKKGEVRNWKGRPINEKSITNEQRKMLTQPCPHSKTKPKQTWLQWLAEKGMSMAGIELGFHTELRNRLEGRVPQTIAGDPNAPVVVIEKIVAHVKEQDGTGNSN